MSKKNNSSASSDALFHMLINLCDDLAWGRPCNEDKLFAMTKEDAAEPQLVRLAEAFGMMLVKVAGREFQREGLIETLQKQNAELEEAKALLAKKNLHLMNTVQETYQANRVIGRCPAMEKLLKLALSIARRPINTLILGPTGSGKEVIAKLIHFNSPRREGPFIAVNCTAIPEALFESEMFGIEKGVATGVGFRKGLIEEANGGTLFLDELGEMPLSGQAKLLRVLEEGQVQRVGRTQPISVDIKVIAATHQNLVQMIEQGKFREDLYYRINVAEICLPPLRERGEDILLLAQKFLEEHCANMRRSRLTLSSQAQEALMRHEWSGNVRELNNEMERVASLTAGTIVNWTDLSPKFSTPKTPGQMTETRLSVPQVQENFDLQEIEKIVIEQALAHTGGNKQQAANLLGITREGLRKKLLRMQKNKT